jgi:uncharacterized protein YjiS (DUF1127 family)
MKRAGKPARFYLFQETHMLLDWYKRTSRYYSIVTELNKLTDKELADIGLTRGEIVFVALEMYVKHEV